MRKGFIHSEATKLKISLSKTGMKYPPRSEETKQKQRIAMLGRKLTPEHCEKIRLLKLGSKWGHHSAESKNKIKMAQFGEKSHLWKGGRYKVPKGYILVHSPGHPFGNARGYVREHRLVLEKSLGRYLFPSEVVHHLNGDKADNRLENLELVASHSEHMKHHHPKPFSHLN